MNPSELELRRVAERKRRRGAAPVRLALTRRVLDDPIHGQCGVCFESRRLQHLVVLGADELPICCGCYETGVPAEARGVEAEARAAHHSIGSRA